MENNRKFWLIGLVCLAVAVAYFVIPIDMLPDIIAAISLYRKLGFCQEGRRKNFYSLPEEDALIFWKDETRADG